MPRSQVARDHGIDPEMLRRWARELSSDSAGAQDTATAPAVSAAELARLRRENEQLRVERDILKKAIGIFSRIPNEPQVSVRGRPGERVEGNDAVPGLGAGSFWLLRLASTLTQLTPGA